MSDRRFGIDRVLLVSTDLELPRPTYSGPAVVRWGLIRGLQECGVDVGFYVGRRLSEGKIRRFDAAVEEMPVARSRFWYNRAGPKVSAASTGALLDVLQAFKPDLVLAYGVEPLRLVRSTGTALPVGIMSIDLEFLPPLHRLTTLLREDDMATRARGILDAPRLLAEAAGEYVAVRRAYPLADFVVNHAAHHAAWHQQRHRRPTLYAPNPVDNLYDALPAPIPTTPPRFNLLGGLKGTATLAGLRWFARGVYPLVEANIRAAEFEVHLAGRRELPAPLLKRMPLVVERGYIDDLEDEMRRTTALLVPTPIKLGFRTRILDAFRHGVTVVAHAANACGMPELADGENSIVVTRPEDFAEGMVSLARDPDLARRLGRTAYEQFSAELSAPSVGAAILRFAASLRNEAVGAPMAGSR